MALGKYKKLLAESRRSSAYWSRVAQRDFTEELLARMGTKTRASLASDAGVTPAYITKVLRGSENFTIETMAKLAFAVGGKVRIHIADLEADTRWVDCHTAGSPRKVLTENTDRDPAEAHKHPKPSRTGKK